MTCDSVPIGARLTLAVTGIVMVFFALFFVVSLVRDWIRWRKLRRQRGRIAAEVRKRQ